MAGRKTSARPPVPHVQTPAVKDPSTQQALEALAQAVRAQQATRAPEAVSITGSRAGGAALENLLTALAELGIITDDTTA